MRIVIAPDSFKGTLTASQACDAIAAGLRRTLPNARLIRVPLADGGEGTVEAITRARQGTLQEIAVTGPLGDPVRAQFGMIDDRNAAVIEMAAAAGLLLVPPEQRNATRTTTFGVGELINAALHAGAKRILVGIGGSATTDGGAGCAQALGVTFYAKDGSILDAPLTGNDLGRIVRIDHASKPPALIDAKITILSDVNNPLTGPNGAARTYAPQKGANSEEVERLDANLAHYANVIRRELNLDVEHLPGAGAAGGLGAGLLAFAGATIQSGAQTVIEYLDLPRQCRGADALITGEGCLDAQSLQGKAVSAVAQLGKHLDIPVYVLVGQDRLPPTSAKDIFSGVVATDNTAPENFEQAFTSLRDAAARAASTWFA